MVPRLTFTAMIMILDMCVVHLAMGAALLPHAMGVASSIHPQRPGPAEKRNLDNMAYCAVWSQSCINVGSSIRWCDAMTMSWKLSLVDLAAAVA
jgi:hypothetical protein